MYLKRLNKQEKYINIYKVTLNISAIDDFAEGADGAGDIKILLLKVCQGGHID